MEREREVKLQSVDFGEIVRGDSGDGSYDALQCKKTFVQVVHSWSKIFSPNSAPPQSPEFSQRVLAYFCTPNMPHLVVLQVFS